MSTPPWRSVVVAAMAATSIAAVPVALASFSTTTSASHSVATATLAAPSAPSAVAGPCIVAVSASIALSWTATPSSWATGYEVLRSTAPGGPYTSIATLTGVSTTTYTDLNLAFLTTYYYVVKATKTNWRSAPTPEFANTTLSSLCL